LVVLVVFLVPVVDVSFLETSFLGSAATALGLLGSALGVGFAAGLLVFFGGAGFLGAGGVGFGSFFGFDSLFFGGGGSGADVSGSASGGAMAAGSGAGSGDGSGVGIGAGIAGNGAVAAATCLRTTEGEICRTVIGCVTFLGAALTPTAISIRINPWMAAEIQSHLRNLLSIN
jgi:hypothetical protein